MKKQGYTTPLVLFLLLLQLIPGRVKSQSVETRFHSLLGTDAELPFWLWANQLGRYDKNNKNIQNLELEASYASPIKNSDFIFESGTLLNFILADNSKVVFTELFAGLNWKFLQIKAGAFAEQELYNGLSSTNGNLANSRNARPHPRIRIGFNRFVPIWGKWLSIYGLYEEGLLNDKRYVNDTHLHHKSFYFRLGKPSSLQFSTGLEHYVMWWGTHPVYGELPGWEDYFNYITSSSGGTLATDQKNAAGNAYGTYQIEFKKAWPQIKASLYISHPFEDRSGLEWENWRDNLYGIYFDLHAKKLLHSFLIEYFFTKHQSGSYHLVEQPDGTYSGRGMDNYFNNGIYRSGVSYEQLAMGSPIFAPINLENNISVGFDNTRISGIHLGADGNILANLSWETLLTYSKNFGHYKSGGATSYNPEKQQLASLVKCSWQPSAHAIFIGASFATDYGSLYTNHTKINFGGMLSLSWKIL